MRFPTEGIPKAYSINILISEELSTIPTNLRQKMVKEGISNVPPEVENQWFLSGICYHVPETKIIEIVELKKKIIREKLRSKTLND